MGAAIASLRLVPGEVVLAVTPAAALVPWIPVCSMETTRSPCPAPSKASDSFPNLVPIRGGLLTLRSSRGLRMAV